MYRVVNRVFCNGLLSCSTDAEITLSILRFVAFCAEPCSHSDAIPLYPTIGQFCFSTSPHFHKSPFPQVPFPQVPISTSPHFHKSPFPQVPISTSPHFRVIRAPAVSCTTVYMKIPQEYLNVENDCLADIAYICRCDEMTTDVTCCRMW